MAEGPVNITAALRDMRKNLVEVKQIRWQDILKHKGNIKLGKTDAQGNWYGASTSDKKEIARLKKDGYKVMKEKPEECAKHDSLKLKKRNEEACQDCGNDPCTCDENLDPDTTNVDERVSASNQTKSKLQKPLTRKDAAGLKLKVKNVISDLDSLAWKLENQIKFDDSKIHSVFPVIKHIDVIIKDIKVLDKELKKIL